MGLEQDIELLSKLELFEGFNQEQLRLLAFGCQKRDLNTGDILYRENAGADCGYVVISGKIDLVKPNDHGNVVLQSLGTGSLMGQLALITETRRMATAIAAEPSHLMRITRTLFRRVLEEFPELAVRIHQRVSDDVQSLVDKIDSVGGRLQRGGF